MNTDKKLQMEGDLKKTISKNLKALMESSNIKNYELADKIGVSESTVGKWLLMKSLPKMGTVEKLAIVFGVNKSDILENKEREPREPKQNLHIKNIEDILEIKTQKIPLIGTIACGVPNLAEENFESYIEIGTDVRCDFALRCSGDSMINARIMDGDIVFIRKQSMVNDGEIAAVIVDGEATLKRVYFSDDYITLQAENPSIKPIIVPLGEDSQIEVRIIGKAVAFQSDVR